MRRRPHRLIAAVVTALALATVAVPQAADAAQQSARYSATKKDPDSPTAAHAPLSSTLNIRQVWAGHTDTHVYLRLKMDHIVTPAEVARTAPYAQVQIKMIANQQAPGEEGLLGFTLGTIVVDKNRTTVTKILQDINPTACQISLSVNRKTDVITVAAPFACGGFSTPDGSVVNFDTTVGTYFTGSAPRGVRQAFEAVEINAR